MKKHETSLKVNKIKARMVELGMTQAQLADKMGINQRTFRFKMNGTMRVYLHDLENLMVILELTPEETVEYFFGNKSSNNETK